MDKWYAVRETTEDSMDIGALDLMSAMSMLMKQGKGIITIIDMNTGVCVEEVAYEDLFREVDNGNC